MKDVGQDKQTKSKTDVV